MAQKPLKSITFPGLTDVYTIPELDTTLATTGKAADAGAVGTALGNKADSSTTYSKTEVDTLLGSKADSSTTYSKTEVDTLLSAKAAITDLTAGTQATANYHLGFYIDSEGYLCQLVDD